DGLVDFGNGEEKNVFRTRRGVEHAIEDWLQQNKAKSLKKSDGRQQQYSGEQLHQKGEHVADEARQLPHGAPARCRPQALAAGRMEMRCKALFYLSRALRECRFGSEFKGAPFPGSLEISPGWGLNRQ